MDKWTPDTFIALAGLLVQATLGGVAIWQFILYRKEQRRLGRERVLHLVDNIMVRLSMDKRGIYIPGMSESASKQVRADLMKILEQEL